MFPGFNKIEQQVHYPSDRRMFVALKGSVVWIILILVLLVISLAWVQYIVSGLPSVATSHPLHVDQVKGYGFPWWLRLTHWVNFFFLITIIRSGLSILADHPRLYWNSGCYPNSEWIRFTPIEVPFDRPYTAKDDARYLSPVLGLPGFRHTIGVARTWHFLHVPFFLMNGVIFISLLFVTDQWQKIIPSSWSIIPDAWNVFVHYVTFNMPVEPNGFYEYNALQKLSYFVVVFMFTPVSVVSGLAMSPAIESRLSWVPKIFGNRQGARSAHFLVMVAYAFFLIAHVTMVLITAPIRNLNHITTGLDDGEDISGIILFGVVMGLVVGFGFLAHWLSWRKPRSLQTLEAKINGALWRKSLNKLSPTTRYLKKDISPYFWKNGKMPDSPEWREHVRTDFHNYRLIVDGLVENPVQLSIDELKKLSTEETITMHHCIQGWTGIAQWRGLSLKALIALVKPNPEVKTVVFHSYGEGLYGGKYYDTHTLENCLKPQSILAWEMNYKRLTNEHGAPLRLRIENQLGYKRVKWISRVEFVTSHKGVGKGYGGTNEDEEYFDLIANT